MAQSLEAKIVVLGSQGVGKTRYSSPSLPLLLPCICMNLRNRIY